MKLIHKLIGLSILLMPFGAIAQEPAKEPANAENQPQQAAIIQKDSAPKVTEVLINQPYPTKAFGDMTLPFMWEAQLDELLKRLVITESRTTSPAVMTIDLVAAPADVDKLELARDVTASLAEALGTTAEVTAQKKTFENCGKKKCPSVDVYKAEITGTENGNDRKCALQIVPINSEMLVFTLCAAADKQYSPELPVILDTVFSNMK